MANASSYLIEKFATFSGISGVQPKILVRDEMAFAEMEPTGHRLAKLQGRDSHREDVATQRISPARGQRVFLPRSRRQMRLDVPPYRLAEDGMALVIDRFDRLQDRRRGHHPLTSASHEMFVHPAREQE